MRFHICLKEGDPGKPRSVDEIEALVGFVDKRALVCVEGLDTNVADNWRPAACYPEFRKILRSTDAGSDAAGATGADRELKKSLQVLSTDDDGNIRALLWQILTDAGHNVEFARDGEEVFKRLAAKNYDLLILDVNMPKMNGYTVSELLHNKLTDPPKVLIFTGRNLEEERLQFVCSGADAILNKVADCDKIIQTIDRLFRREPEEAAPPAAVLTQEPAPPGIETAPARTEPEKLQKEEFYPENNEEPPAQAPKPPAAGGGGQAAVLDRLISENKALKADLADVRRVLAHIELSHAQTAQQFANQLSSALSETREDARKLGAEWKALRLYLAAATLVLLAAAAILW